MKLKLKIKPKLNSDRVLKDADRDVNRIFKGGAKAPSWMMTRRDQQREAVERQKLLSGGKRPPEVWFKDGDSKRFRFRSEGPIATIFQYSLRVNGKWATFTAPGEDEVDLFKEELGLRPALKAVYEVIDIDGYVDKDGKKHRNVARFFVANSRLFSQLEKIREKCKGGLCSRVIEVTREGEKTNTTYTAVSEDPSPMTPEQLKPEKLALQFIDYYAPLPEAEQRVIVRSANVNRDEE